MIIVVRSTVVYYYKSTFWNAIIHVFNILSGTRGAEVCL